jgi:hypothetical protein
MPHIADEDPIRPLDHFRGAREAARPEDRLRQIRLRAARFREEMLAGPAVTCFRSRALVRVPYPSRYALLNALSLPVPMVHIVNRVFLIQWESEGARKTLLVSPSDVTANSETPFFKRLRRGFGPFQESGKRFLAPELGTVEGSLAEAGISPEDVDYITYDHLHTQDLRKWLGTAGHPGFFPRAKLLIMRAEWESAEALLPPQRDWYCPGGLDGVDPARVVLLNGDVMLGESVALIHTPGHTEGNHSIVTHTPEGLFVTSENGVAPDSYAPLASRIPGVARYAAETGMEVILNGNTLERGIDQYLSMIQEKEIAGPSLRNPNFPNLVCSSELAAFWAFPGIRPTFAFGDIDLGMPAARKVKTSPSPSLSDSTHWN